MEQWHNGGLRRLDQISALLDALATAPSIAFREMTPSKLPMKCGVYVIFDSRGEVIRAGKAAGQHLSGRLYSNPLMGSQSGNLRAQLVNAGVCVDQPSAKAWVRENCFARCVAEDVLSELGLDISTAEYFLLGVLKPRFCS
jgi:hypothetical protein